MPLSKRNQQTLGEYYEHTNVGDFAGALKYFTDDVTYWLPNASQKVPYAGEWHGKEGAAEVYAAFGEAFSLVDMTEICSISTDDEVFSVNDEIFVAKDTGQPWRLGVVHHIRFRDGLIERLAAHLDLGAAHEALSGRTPLPSPILPVDALPGADTVPLAKAEEVAAAYLSDFPARSDLLASQATAYMPGDQRRLRFAGTWSGRDELSRMATHWTNSLDVSLTVQHMIAERGNVVALVALNGTFLPTRTPVNLETAVLFQITADARIGRMAWYLNTYPLVALPN